MVLPERQGRRSNEAVPLDDVAKPQDARHTLKDVLVDYGLVHYGVLLACGLEVDPAEEFAARYPDAEVFPIVFGVDIAEAPQIAPFLRRSLVLVSRPHFPALVDHLRKITIVDRAQNGAAAAFVVTLPLPDPVIRSRSVFTADVPEVPVTYVGVESGRLTWDWLVPAPGRLPKLVRRGATENGKALAKALLVDRLENPLTAIEVPVEVLLASVPGLAPPVGDG